MSPREIIDWTLQKSGWGTLAELEAKKWIDCQPEFDKAHYIGGFAYPDRSSASSRTGRTCRRRAPTASRSTATCRACPTTGT